MRETERRRRHRSIPSDAPTPRVKRIAASRSPAPAAPRHSHPLVISPRGGVSSVLSTPPHHYPIALPLALRLPHTESSPQQTMKDPFLHHPPPPTPPIRTERRCPLQRIGLTPTT